MRSNFFFTGLLTAICFVAASVRPTFAADAQAKYFALPLAKSADQSASPKIVNRYGVGFIEGSLDFDADHTARVEIGCGVKRLFLLGMTDSSKPRAWSHPQDYSRRFFIGDELGRIRLDYADGSRQIFPLILGESIWWGELFYDNPEPFFIDRHFRDALTVALRLYPPAPVADGNYLAVIIPRAGVIRSISVETSAIRQGVAVINGITIEPAAGATVAGAVALSSKPLSRDFANFAHQKSLRELGREESVAESRLAGLRRVLYSSDADYHGHAAPEIPPGYAGPEVSFQGDIFAKILANAFRANLHDMSGKVTDDGMYHTSTKGSRSWGSYNGFGTYQPHLGKYYDSSWCRDMGRSLQELTELGYLDRARRCADYCFAMARLWEERPQLRIDGTVIPRHWGRVINHPGKAGCFENDGHGLTSLFIYKLWQRLPDREQWLRARWPDVQAAGDWISWQFDHPKISGATDVLHTTGESASMNGYTVYADAVCMDALRGLAQMADSIGEKASAERWRARAEMMRKAISSHYIITDPKYGRVWTLDYAGWPQQSTVLGPLMFVADYRGFAPADDDPNWRAVSQAAYQRLIDTYQPFGFYGQAMGYGQGFVTESSLLLDRMHDATQMLDWAAKEIYDPKFDSYIVPEGCEIDQSGRYWYRIGDLGNGVQEAEIIKTLRLMIGVDDTQPARLQFYPRMPYGWNEMAVEKYPVLVKRAGKMEMTHLRYKLERTAAGMKLQIAADADLGPIAMRLGPFAKRPGKSAIVINGEVQDAAMEYSGDSWWAKFMSTVSPGARVMEQQ